MKEFLANHKESVWVLLVCLSAMGGYYLLKFLLAQISKHWKRADEFTDVFKVLLRICRLFFIAISIGLISYIFFEKESYVLINANIGRTIWIALVAMGIVLSVALSQHYFAKKIATLSKRDSGDSTTYKYLSYLSTFTIYLVGIILIALSVPALRNFGVTAAGGAGVFALIAGVAAQEGFANLAGGLFIAFFKPFRIGDIVKIGNNVVGRVEDLNLRHTIINDFQNKRVVIPNAIMNKEQITNYYLNEYKICEWIEVSVSYESNLDLAIELLRETCERHPLRMDQRTSDQKAQNTPIVDVQVIELGDSGVLLKAWVWCASYLTGFKMRNEIYRAVKKSFEENGIEIPYPHTALIFKGDGEREKRNPRNAYPR